MTGIPIVDLATKVIIGHTIRELGYTPGLQRSADYVAVKMPVFSFEKLRERRFPWAGDEVHRRMSGNRQNL